MLGGRVSQPSGQVRLTNVAVVRLRRGGRRFEVAAYKNKVMDWRSGVEGDINEVLQVPTVFVNVSKGVQAKSADLLAAFGSDDHAAAALVILRAGEFEVGDREREAHLSALSRDVATLVADRTVNPETGRPYTVSIIDKALREVHFGVAAGKPAKAQALRAIAALSAYLPIARARMRLRVTVPAAGADAAARVLAAAGAPGAAHAPAPGGRATFDVVLDPGAYRAIEDGLRAAGVVGGAVEVVAMTEPAHAGGGAGGGGGTGGGGGGGGGGGAGGAGARTGGGGGGQDIDEAADDDEGDDEDGDDDGDGAAGGAAAGGDGRAPRAGAAPSPAREPALPQQSRGGGGPGGGGVGGPGGGGGGGGGPGGVHHRAGDAGDRPADAAAVAAALADAAARGTGVAVPRRVALPAPGRRLACSACAGAAFDDADAHRAHHRSDWHRLNLKRKVAGAPPLTEEEFGGLGVKEVARLLSVDS